MITPDLRPLGVGEVLDRAVTLFVRHFAVLVFILALVAVPAAIVSYAVAPSSDSFFTDVQRLLAVPPGHDAERSTILRELSTKNRLGALTASVLVVSSVFELLAFTACMIAVAQAYAGRTPSVRDVYREAVRRWLPQLAALAIFVGLGFVAIVLVVIVAVLAALAIGALATVSKVGAIVLGVPVAIVGFAAYMLILVLLYLAAQLTTVAIALEDPNPIRGIAAGLRRTFAPALFWRSALVGTIVFAVSLIGAIVLLSIGATVAALTHLAALATVVSVVGGLALNGLVTAFIVIYAIDVRVRREGYDLELAARVGSV